MYIASRHHELFRAKVCKGRINVQTLDGPRLTTRKGELNARIPPAVKSGCFPGEPDKTSRDKTSHAIFLHPGQKHPTKICHPGQNIPRCFCHPGHNIPCHFCHPGHNIPCHFCHPGQNIPYSDCFFRVSLICDLHLL